MTPDDILIDKVMPLRVPTGAVLPAVAKKSRDVSKMPRNNEKGYMDKIYKNRTGEGYSFVKVRMRQDQTCFLSLRSKATKSTRAWPCVFSEKCS